MSVSSTDLVLYHAATQSDQDGIPVGGAIDPLRRADFSEPGSPVALEVVSSAPGDTTQTITVTGRDSQGRLVAQTTSLNGTTVVSLGALGTVQRVLQAELSATTTGSITLRAAGAGATVRVIPAGERGFSAVLRKAASSVAGAVTYYAKVFWKNVNGANALLGATIAEAADPAGIVTHGVALAVNDSATTTDRKTAPAGVTIDGTAKAIPGTDLAAGAAIGVWLAFALTTAAAAILSTYTPQISGTST